MKNNEHFRLSGFTFQYCFVSLRFQTQLDCLDTQQSAVVTDLARSNFFWALSFSHKTCAIWKLMCDFISQELSPPCVSSILCYFTIVAVSSYISLIGSFLVISSRKQTIPAQASIMSELSLLTPFRYLTFFSTDTCKPIPKLLISQRSITYPGVRCSELFQ